MRALKKRLRKLRVKDSGATDNTSIISAKSLTSQLPCGDAVVDQLDANVPLGLTAQLWNDAYNTLKSKEAKLINTYESLLSKELATSDTIASDGPRRRAQMEEFLKRGLARTESEAAIKKAISQVSQTLISIKDSIAVGLTTSSEASLAWAAFTGALPLLLNAVDQSEKHRDGINEVGAILVKTDTMAPYRLGETGPFQDILRTLLEKLYQKILCFLIRATCYCDRNRLLVIARDAIKLDDWDKQIKEIKEADEEVMKLDCDVKLQTTAQYQREHLADIRDEKDNASLARLKLSDPRHDKKRIEASKGGLLHESLSWIFSTDEFLTWEKQGDILWVRGDPGKGKTMLLCGIINELNSTPNSKLAYFFCQATNNAINTALAVLRGLIYMLADETPSLIAIVRKRLDKSNDIFDANSWYMLTEILEEMLTKDHCIVIDALDECIEGRQDLIRFITTNHDKARWIISSRNWLDIETELQHTPRVSLEVNSSSVSQAVKRYIQFKVDQLATSKKYDQQTAEFVSFYLNEHANGTFLWVALVCMNLTHARNWNVRSVLEKFPSDLNDLYDRMWQMTRERDDTGLLQRILGLSALVLRPISLAELQVVLDMPVDIINSLEEVVQDCGSFLGVNKKGVIEFVHQSAKEYVDKRTYSSSKLLHQDIFSRSMQALLCTLRRDIYGLEDPAVSISEVRKLNLEVDPLVSVRYACVNWGYHLFTSGHISIMDQNLLQEFFTSCYLQWLEAMSLLSSSTTVVLTMYRLESQLEQARIGCAESEELSQQHNVSLRNLVFDARRFVQYFRNLVEDFPLQIYYGGLLFSPKNSLIRKAFSSEAPRAIQVASYAYNDWSPNLIYLDTRADETGIKAWPYISVISFSQDSEQIAIGFSDRLVQVYHVKSMNLIQTVRLPTIPNVGVNYCIKFAFLQGTNRILCQTYGGCAAIWNLETNDISILDLKEVLSISKHGLIAFRERKNSIQFYDTVETKGHTYPELDLQLFIQPDSFSPDTNRITPLVFAVNTKTIAVRVAERTVEIWCFKTKLLQSTVTTAHRRHDGMSLSEKYLATSEFPEDEITEQTSSDLPIDYEFAVHLYDLRNGCLLWRYSVEADPGYDISQIEISQNNQFLTFTNPCSYVLETSSGTCLWKSKGLMWAWLSPNLQWLFSVDGPGTDIVLQDFFKIQTNTTDEDTNENSQYRCLVALSADASRMLTETPSSLPKWHTSIVEIDTNEVIWQANDHWGPNTSGDMKLIILGGYKESKIYRLLPSGSQMILKLDDLVENEHNLRYERGNCSVAPNNSYVATVGNGNRVVIWHLATRTEILSVDCWMRLEAMQWSSDSKKIGLYGSPGLILVDIDTKQELLRNHSATGIGFSDNGMSLMIWHPYPYDILKDTFPRRASVSLQESPSSQYLSEDDVVYELADENRDRRGFTSQGMKKGGIKELCNREIPEIQDGTWIDWDVVKSCGRVLKGFCPNLLLKTFCFNSSFLVAMNVPGQHHPPAMIRVWDRISGRQIGQCEHLSIYDYSMELEGDILRFDNGVITIEPDGLHLGSQDECFNDGRWLWLRNKRFARIPADYNKPKYKNRTMGINRKDGGFIVLRCYGGNS